MRGPLPSASRLQGLRYLWAVCRVLLGAVSVLQKRVHPAVAAHVRQVDVPHLRRTWPGAGRLLRGALCKRQLCGTGNSQSPRPLGWRRPRP